MIGRLAGLRLALERDGWDWTHGHGRMLGMRCPEGRGVMISLAADDADLHIDHIRAIMPGRGDGSAALQRLLLVTDALDLDILLRAVPQGGSRGGFDIRSWYERFGFEAAGFGPADLMLRCARRPDDPSPG